MLVYQRVYPIVGGYSCVDTYQLVQDFATIHSISYDRILIYSNIVDDCEILHQLKTVVNIPLFCWGFNHPFGDAGFLPSTVCRVYNMYNSEKWDVALIDMNL